MNAPVTLRRVLKFRTVVSTSTGLAFAAISFLGCVQLASLVGGDSGWIAMVIAGDSYIVGSAITYAFNLPNWASLIWILALLGLATGANLRGIKIAGLLQDITTYSLLAFAVIISLIALAKNGFQLHNPFDALYHPDALVNAVAVGVFVFSAFEWVTPLSEEIADIRLIPRGMFIALALLGVSYALFTLASSSLLNVHSPSIYNSPVPQMLLSQAALGQVGIWLMLIATLLTAVMTFNGGFATASRFLYAAAREDTLPQIFARISYTFAVPYVTVMVLTVLSAVSAVIIFFTNQFTILILVGAVLEALIYTVAGLCVIQLRRRQPAAQRAFRIWGGWTIPIATIVVFGILGILAALNVDPQGNISPTP